MIDNILEKAAHTSETERVLLFAEFVDNPDLSLKELTNVLRQPTKKHIWAMSLQAMHTIGYPRNASVLPEVVDHLVDGNWPGWRDALNLLMDADPIAVASLYIKILLDQGETRKYWADDVDGICTALFQMRKDSVVLCVPSLLYLLAKYTGEDEPDTEFLLRPLQQIEISEYLSALPILIYAARGAKQEEARASARSFIRAFSPQNVALYKDSLSTTML